VKKRRFMGFLGSSGFGKRRPWSKNTKNPPPWSETSEAKIENKFPPTRPKRKGKQNVGAIGPKGRTGVALGGDTVYSKNKRKRSRGVGIVNSDGSTDRKNHGACEGEGTYLGESYRVIVYPNSRTERSS